MLEQIANDIWNYIQIVFGSGDWIAAAMALVIAVFAAFLMSGFGNIVNTTVGALVVFGLAQVVRGILTKSPDVTMEQSLGYSWDAFMAVSMGLLLVYFVAFLVVIAVFYLIRSAIRR